MITGPSGSGKSSLAFDTVYAEGQRRYVESLSTHGRLFLDQMKKPDVDAIDGLSPAIAIEQKSTSASPRSTVGTVTEVYDYLRLLFARAGTPHCPQCDRPISSQSLEDMCEKVMSLGEGTPVELLAPVVRGRKGAYRKELENFRKRGFVRVRIDGETYDLNKATGLDGTFPDNPDSTPNVTTLSGTTTGTLIDTGATEDAAFYQVKQQP